MISDPYDVVRKHGLLVLLSLTESERCVSVGGASKALLPAAAAADRLQETLALQYIVKSESKSQQ